MLQYILFLEMQYWIFVENSVDSVLFFCFKMHFLTCLFLLNYIFVKCFFNTGTSIMSLKLDNLSLKTLWHCYD